jgi:transposase
MRRRRRIVVDKIRELLRLGMALGIAHRQIGQSMGISHTIVGAYLRRAAASGLDHQKVSSMSDEELRRILRSDPEAAPAAKPLPDWETLHKEMAKKGVTLALLWEEYLARHPDGYRYTQFSCLYRRWRKKLSAVMRQHHTPGEKLFVDYAGPTIPIHDPLTGEARPAYIFVAVLGLSNYTYAEAVRDMKLDSWLLSHIRAFEYFGGSAKIIVPDNPKTAVTETCRYEPGVNRSYLEMAEHYGACVMPARPAKPRDKAKVESGVLVVERWILAALRNRKFFSLEELNDAIAELLERLNTREFKKLSGSRKTWFEELEKPSLTPLPNERHQIHHWKNAKVNIDYHVELDRHYYSVPYACIGKDVQIRYSATSLEVFLAGKRVASHARSYSEGRHTTTSSHMPQSHRTHLEWSPSRILSWADSVGPKTRELSETILKSRPHPEQGYRSCIGIIALSKCYGQKRLEAASARALAIRSYSYRSVKSILQRRLDESAQVVLPRVVGGLHENIRGGDYFISVQKQQENHNAQKSNDSEA